MVGDGTIKNLSPSDLIIIISARSTLTYIWTNNLFSYKTIIEILRIRDCMKWTRYGMNETIQSDTDNVGHPKN